MVAKPTPENPSFPEDAYRSGSANEFVGYSYLDDPEYLNSDDDNRIAFVKKGDRFFAPMYLYDVPEDYELFDENLYTYDNVPEGYEVRTTADYRLTTSSSSTLIEYDTMYGDECLILDRSKGDNLYVASSTALADIQVFNSYCLLPVVDHGTYGGIVGGVIQEVQRVSRSDGDAFDSALSSLGIKLYNGRSGVSDSTATFISGTVPQTITVASNSGEWTENLDRYYTVAPKYHNPTDSGIQVGIQEQTDNYAVLDISSIDPGRYLVPSYNEGYMLVEIR